MALPALILFALLAQAPDFVCPMDPDVRSAKPGKCPRCGMTLKANVPEPVEYPTTFRFQPPRLTIEVHDPKTGAPVHDFEVVHEKLMHLFVISSDLEYFAHMHPHNGTIDLNLPKPGVYKVAADFYPRGGTPQMIEKFITTLGYQKPIAESLADPVADLAPKLGENMEVEMAMDPPEPVPGKKTLLFFKVKPADGLEPYIGAWAHMLLASNDMIDMIHTHPTIADGGPKLQFDVYFPRAATYRIWVQFQRLGKVNTVAFTVPVHALR